MLVRSDGSQKVDKRVGDGCRPSVLVDSTWMQLGARKKGHSRFRRGAPLQSHGWRGSFSCSVVVSHTSLRHTTRVRSSATQQVIWALRGRKETHGKLINGKEEDDCIEMAGVSSFVLTTVNIVWMRQALLVVGGIADPGFV